VDKRLAVRRFLVGVGQRQVGRAGLQHVDQVLREVLADLHDRQVRTQGRRCERSAVLALFRLVTTRLVAALSMKSVPLTRGSQDRGPPH